MTQVTSRPLHCCGCNAVVNARLTSGTEIYPHRTDLWRRPFWICDVCLNYIGTHWKTSKPTKPLGCIPTPELRDARKQIHALLDPLWKTRRMKRRHIYEHLSEVIGRTYHTGEIATIEEARAVYSALLKLKRGQVS